MKPPMNQKVTAQVPILDENGTPQTDRYGRPITESVLSKARVQFKANVVTDNEGREIQVNLEIDLPPNFNPVIGSTISYETVDGRTATGTIRAKEDAMNLSGRKVYYRTVFVE